MAEELGSWPPEQATVLLEVLQKAGLSPQAKRTRDGVLVTVPEDESDEAHRQLVANMDAIARAARQARPSPTNPSARRPRPVKGADNVDSGEQRRALASERLTRIARPLGFALIALLLLATIGRFQPVLGIFVVGGLVYLIGKRAQARGDDDGRSDRLR